MNKYARTPDRSLDLHGYTKREAEVLLDALFAKPTYSHVRIITGKGTHGDSGAVLRTYVKTYLQTRGLRFNQAKIADGGEGALEVFVT